MKKSSRPTVGLNETQVLVMAEDRINNSNFSNIRAIIPLLLSYPEILCLTLVWSLGSEFGERIWPNIGLAGSEFGEKKRAKLWFGRFGVQRKGKGQTLVWQVRSSDKAPGRTLVWSLGSELGERMWPNPGLEFGEKERAKPWFGRFGVQIKDLAEPWFGVWVRSSEKGCGLTLVWQVWSSEKRKGPNPGLAGSEFGYRTWPNPGLEFGFGVRRKDVA